MSKLPKIKKILLQEENKLNKPNILINVVNQKSLTLKSKKIYNILLRQLLDQSEEDFHLPYIATSLSAIAKELGIKNIKEVSEGLDELLSQRILFEHPIDGKIHTSKTHLISKVSIEKIKQNSVKIYFDNDLKKEILKYNNRWTKLDLIECNRLKVSHSLTLYELFKSKICGYKIQNKNYTETQLREKLGLTDSYKEIRLFNSAVIKKSIDDINKNMSIQVKLLKIERANTKSNPTDERIYKFKIIQNISKTISLGSFIDFIRSRNKIICMNFKGHIYSLESDGMFQSDCKYWYRVISNEKTTSVIADKIWKELYKRFLEDSQTVLNTLKIDIVELEDWQLLGK